MSFSSPIAASSPPNARRNGRAQSYDRLDRSTSNATVSFSSRTGLGSSTSTIPPAAGTIAGPLGLGFAPSQTDAYLGIQVACEKIAKTHGFQSDAVFRVSQEVKDLRKAEEIVMGMKRAAEKDAIERITKAREKSERRRVSERPGESSSYWERDASRTSRRRLQVRLCPFRSLHILIIRLAPVDLSQRLCSGMTRVHPALLHQDPKYRGQ